MKTFVAILTAGIFAANFPGVTAHAQDAAPTTPEAPQRGPDVVYVPTNEKVVDEMLAMAKVTKNDVVYDLGCGDGRFIVTAAKRFGARGVGIDIDPARIAEARKNVQEAGVEDKVKIINGDLFQSDFRDATVITLYLLESLNLKLRPQIFAQARPGTRVVSHAFTMSDWKPDEQKRIDVNGSVYNVYYWMVPANMSGTWKVTGGGEGKGISAVTIDQKFQEITGTAMFGNESRPIGEGKVEGHSFTFTVPDEKGKPLTVTGKIVGEKIEATADDGRKWTAERQAETKKTIAVVGR